MFSITDLNQKLTTESDRKKSQNTWILNNTFLNNSWLKQEVSREIKQYFELKEKATYQNLQDEAKVVLRGKFKVLSAYIRKGKHLKLITQISTLARRGRKQ